MLSIWEVWVDTSKKTDASLVITQTVGFTAMHIIFYLLSPDFFSKASILYNLKIVKSKKSYALRFLKWWLCKNLIESVCTSFKFVKYFEVLCKMTDPTYLDSICSKLISLSKSNNFASKLTNNKSFYLFTQFYYVLRLIIRDQDFKNWYQFKVFPIDEKNNVHEHYLKCTS